MIKFPSTIFVRKEKGGRDEPNFLLLFNTPEEAVEDDGPTIVASYQLVSRRVLRKTLGLVREIRTSRRDKVK